MAIDYASSRIILNTFSVRKYVDDMKGINLYTNNVQKDAAEFLSDLVDIIPSIEQHLMFVLNVRRRCMGCRFENIQSVPNKIFGIKVSSDIKNHSLSEILSRHINLWAPEST